MQRVVVSFQYPASIIPGNLSLNDTRSCELPKIRLGNRAMISLILLLHPALDELIESEDRFNSVVESFLNSVVEEEDD